MSARRLIIDVAVSAPDGALSWLVQDELSGQTYRACGWLELNSTLSRLVDDISLGAAAPETGAPGV